MKKFFASLLAFCLVFTSIAIVPMTVVAEDANSRVYVSASGNDSNAGTSDAPVATLGKAISLVEDNGIIVVNGTVSPANNDAFAGSKLGKTVTVIGGDNGVIDLTGVQFAQLRNNMTFKDISLKFTSSYYLFACGYKLVIAETVTFAEGSGAPHVFGGAYQAKSGSTDITLLAGTYTNVYGGSHDTAYTVNGDTNVHFGGTATATSVTGGSNKGTVTGNSNVLIDGNANVKTVSGASSGTVEGNTYVTVKGNANPNAAPSDDSHDGGGYKIYGGGNGAVNGSTHVYFMDNAKSGYVVGGTSSENGSVGGTANVYMMGGTTYSVYGVGTTTAADANISANIVMTGGTAWQVFGGCETTGGESGTCINGDITIKLLGGTVKRRVYGGSYNETSGLSFGTGHYVKGKINLVISEGVTVDFSSTDNDESIYAHSRHNSPSTEETSSIIFVNKAAYDKYNGKLCASDFAMKLIMGSTSAADEKHLYSYAMNENEITQTCSEHSSHSATATVTPSGNLYTGEAIEVDIEYSDNWEFEQFDVSYTNNVNAGTATATLEIKGVNSLTYNYTIAKLTQKAPEVKASNNTVKGLTTDMEYSTDGITYTDVTDPAMTFENGVYYIRLKESDNTAASPAVKVYLGNVLSANKVNTVSGATVDVIVQIPVNTGIDSLNVTIDYDKTALTLTGVTAGDFAGVALDENVITWSGAETDRTGVIARLTFKVSEDAELGSYAIVLKADGLTAISGEIKVSEFVCGDVNGDSGKINMNDIISLRAAIANTTLDDLNQGADVNGDGTVDARDLILLRQYLANYNYSTGESDVVLGGN